ncbi:MAG TPA: GlsB/YeaQ/YmgE family stress response membrane protein [Pseudolysinimonas sp.]
MTIDWEVVVAGFLGFILLGLIAGAIAKLILPGKQGGGWIATLLLGVAGALLAGWLGGLLFGYSYEGFFDITSWIVAIVGALIVLVIWGLITRRRKA